MGRGRWCLSELDSGFETGIWDGNLPVQAHANFSGSV